MKNNRRKIKIDLKLRDRQSGKTTKLIKKINGLSEDALKTSVCIFKYDPHKDFKKNTHIIAYSESELKGSIKKLKRLKLKRIFLDDFSFFDKKLLANIKEYAIKNEIKVVGYSSNRYIDHLHILNFDPRHELKQ